ncbi:hypothetical protein BAUCODRAFT_325315 [Baudoinia panamericana UAMH 10762]|uniref:AAA+ ATPase domain-containing protein n=1 Tax=Baudoinia panamericana (strain UAMH 10762) TaxID=717646 RepID=M2MXG7_BAUPA|nr:uncharacterized protein BAUCODRAFT_325315 [Baudoinia panamericana UAMH 10762]EMC91359.1 hypothetical protein BAUCODRAFT_325315 [Baudoinia panamericana UAMH 10762]
MPRINALYIRSESSMKRNNLLAPTIHIEAALHSQPTGLDSEHKLRQEIQEWLLNVYKTVTVGLDIVGYGRKLPLVAAIHIADYTGPPKEPAYYELAQVDIDVQIYALHGSAKVDGRRVIVQSTGDEALEPRIIELPHGDLEDEWSSLVFDDALPARLLRYLARMMSMMKQPGLILTTFNWNRLCLLHGPPGSGKSTLCRALAQKLSIRLSNQFTKAKLVEINTNTMLSKYFGESGKLVSKAFEDIFNTAQDGTTLICVVMDEVETIAGSRERSATGGECNDGLRATNQLLTALDRLRQLPNVIVLCTSNMITAIDHAFLDRVDIKQFVPSPSPAAIYNIFRSCLNELIRSNLVEMARVSRDPRQAKRSRTSPPSATSSSPEHEPSVPVPAPELPTFSELQLNFMDRPQSPAYRVWIVARNSQGFSGRTLRRLPILGLAMYTWGGSITVDDAISALEAAVEQELTAVKRKAVHFGIDGGLVNGK